MTLEHLTRLSAKPALLVLLLFVGLSLSVGAVHATDCPPGSYSDCVAAVSGPWNPLVPVIGAIAGAGIAGLFVRGKTATPPPVFVSNPPAANLPIDKPAGPLPTSSVPPNAPPADSFPEDLGSGVTLTSDPLKPPPRSTQVPTMQSTSSTGQTTDGGKIRIPSGSRPVGSPDFDGTPGDGRYQDSHGNPVGAPTDFQKTSEVVTHLDLPPGLISTGIPIVDEVLYSGSDTLPGTGIPGTPSTTETGDPRVRYKQIIYDNPKTNTRYTYKFWRNEGPLANPFFDEGTWRLTGRPTVSQIPK